MWLENRDEAHYMLKHIFLGVPGEEASLHEEVRTIHA